MTEPRIAYLPHADATPTGELNALAAVYKLCLETSHARKRGRLPDKSGPDDARERINDARTYSHCT